MVLVLAACGSEPRPLRAATLHVRQEWAGGGLYVEGSYSYVRVQQSKRSIVQVRLTGEKVPRGTIRLEPGSYRLVSFQRPCEGNCGMLDPATDQCSRIIEVESSAEIRTVVRLSPGEGCQIEREFRID